MPDMPEGAIKALIRKYILAVAGYGVYLLLRQMLGSMPLLAIAHIPLHHALIFGHRAISGLLILGSGANGAKKGVLFH